MSKRRPYVRPMGGWWKKNPFFIEYMIHEGTAFFVAAYALNLLCGLLRLTQGKAAWDAWMSAMQSPLAILYHAVILVAMLYHTYTWFKIMPKTLPPIMVGGKKVGACVITGGGLLAAAGASILLLALVWRMAS